MDAIPRTYQQMTAIPGNGSVKLNKFLNKIDNLKEPFNFNNSSFKINTKDEFGNTLLHRIIINSLDENELLNKIDFLPNVHILINAVNRKKQTPLHLLCKYQYYDAYVKIRDMCNGNYVVKDDEDVLKSIIDMNGGNDKNIDINYYAIDNKNRTPLSYLVKGVNLKMNKSNKKIENILKDIDINVYKNLSTVDTDEKFLNKLKEIFDVIVANENIHCLIINNEFVIRFINKDFFDEMCKNSKRIISNKSIMVDNNPITMFVKEDKLKDIKYNSYWSIVSRYILKKILNDYDTTKYITKLKLATYIGKKLTELNTETDLLEDDNIYALLRNNEDNKTTTSLNDIIDNIMNTDDNNEKIENICEYFYQHNSDNNNVYVLLMLSNYLKSIDKSTVENNYKSIVEIISNAKKYIKQKDYYQDAIMTKRIILFIIYAYNAGISLDNFDTSFNDENIKNFIGNNTEHIQKAMIGINVNGNIRYPFSTDENMIQTYYAINYDTYMYLLLDIINKGIDDEKIKKKIMAYKMNQMYRGIDVNRPDGNAIDDVNKYNLFYVCDGCEDYVFEGLEIIHNAKQLNNIISSEELNNINIFGFKNGNFDFENNINLVIDNRVLKVNNGGIQGINITSINDLLTNLDNIDSIENNGRSYNSRNFINVLHIAIAIKRIYDNLIVYQTPYEVDNINTTMFDRRILVDYNAQHVKIYMYLVINNIIYQMIKYDNVNNTNINPNNYVWNPANAFESYYNNNIEMFKDALKRDNLSINKIFNIRDNIDSFDLNNNFTTLASIIAQKVKITDMFKSNNSNRFIDTISTFVSNNKYINMFYQRIEHEINILNAVDYCSTISFDISDNSSNDNIIDKLKEVDRQYKDVYNSSITMINRYWLNKEELKEKRKQK